MKVMKRKNQQKSFSLPTFLSHAVRQNQKCLVIYMLLQFLIKTLNQMVNKKEKNNDITKK